MSHTDFNKAFDLTGQTALITGGGTGLGFGMAWCFVASGARVVLVGRRKVKLAQACSLLGDNAFALPGDVTKLKTAGAIFEAAERLAGPVTILVNNAGVHLKKPAAQTTDAEFASEPVWKVSKDFTLSLSYFCAQFRTSCGCVIQLI